MVTVTGTAYSDKNFSRKGNSDGDDDGDGDGGGGGDNDGDGDGDHSNNNNNNTFQKTAQSNTTHKCTAS